MISIIRRHKWKSGLALLLAVAGGSFVVWSSLNAAQPDRRTSLPATDEEAVTLGLKMRVLTVNPTVGGAIRQTSLPCSAHWHDYADLYAKVSGYLSELQVDIGSRVRQGDLLAKIDVPELDQDVALAEATLEHSLAAVEQAEARKKSAAAEQRAAEAMCVKAEADIERWTAECSFREKEYRRFQELNKSDSVHRALVDEKLFQWQSVQAAHRSAESAVLTAREQAAAAAARVELAVADLGVAKAQAKIAKAGVDKARVYASFASITSPYDGVVTARNFHRGEFIRAADKGAGRSLLMVGRTDLIRVVVQIPDREVPYAHVGDPVTIEFDALPGKTFEAKLSRIAFSEDITTRTMRAEVDLANNEGLILDQMYGRMRIVLEPAANTLTLPSVCLVGDLGQGKAQAFVVRDGVARLQSLVVGAHNGVSCEVLDGLQPSDDIVIRPPANLTEGTIVDAKADPAAATSSPP